MLEKIDLTQKFKNKKDYEKALATYQLRLLQLEGRIIEAETPVLIAFEGWDAAGKGGAIRRLTQRLDPRAYKVYATRAPDAVEKTHHYLHRFWLRLPRKGEVAIFDRTWYGRVLVERVERFATKEEWRRAYREINEFERTLVDSGVVLLKFWLHISKDEQLRRFREREANPYKQWKIGPEDWRNRKKWNRYEEAVEEMLEKTDTRNAPWRLVPANFKWYARVSVLKTMVRTLEGVLGRS
ncbi:MAG: UDP-galactose-lipid carrier transferase [Candidatus Latescibacteria bacterium]|nr:UDP-galactose-lipid carrier transferase [Candidatus Latescibacterota bacterium]